MKQSYENVENFHCGASYHYTQAERHYGHLDLIDSVQPALDQTGDSVKSNSYIGVAAQHIAALTPRQREIMEMVVAGNRNKNIATDLRISQRTVEAHRAIVMKKLGCNSVPALVKLALAAAN
jgi:two-component system CheB/CheR fusion protein